MIYIIAGDESQARQCADIKGLGHSEWKRVTSLEHLRGIEWKGSAIYTFGTFRTRHMFEWREMVEHVRARGGKIEQVVDGRLTR